MRERAAPDELPELEEIRRDRVLDHSRSLRNGALTFVPTFLLCFLVLGWAFWKNFGGPRASPPPAEPGPPPMELVRASIAFDWEARRELQAGLEAIAATVTDESRGTLHRAATEARDLLGAHLDRTARFAIFSRTRAAPSEAEGAFRQQTLELRSRFSVDSVRNAERVDGAGIAASPHEGEGMVVVSLVVVSSSPLPAAPTTVSRDAMRALLSAALPTAAHQLVAFEVIWSPAEEDDRMSSAELRTLYPELLPLDDEAAALGRVVCSHCIAPYTAELDRCPVCGAPS